MKPIYKILAYLSKYILGKRLILGNRDILSGQYISKTFTIKKFKTGILETLINSDSQ